MGTITIRPGAATEDAAQIDKIISDIEEDMENLNSIIQQTIPNDIETAWSETVKSNWDKYYKSDIPETMAEMKMSATNLRTAIHEALKYSQEQ